MITIITHDLEKIAEEIENEKKLDNIIDCFEKELKSPLNSLFFSSSYFSSEGYDLDVSEKNKNYRISSMFKFKCKGKKLSSEYAPFGAFLSIPVPKLPDGFKSYAAEPYIFIDYKKNKTEGHYIIQRINNIFYIDIRQPAFTNKDQPIFSNDLVSLAEISGALENIVTITQATINECYNAGRHLFRPKPYSIHIYPVGHDIKARQAKLKLIENKEELLHSSSDVPKPKLKLIKKGDEQ